MSDSSPAQHSGSLILGNGTQLKLLDTDEVIGLPPSAFERSEDRGRWTGDRLFFAEPRIYGAIAKLLARGVPYREISEILEVSVNSVCAVVYREGIPIETLRERIGRLGLDVAMLSLEAIRDLLADPVTRREMSGKDLAVIHGIATTNAQLLLGGATARIDSTPGAVPDHEAYLAYLKNVTPSATGLRGQNRRPNAAGPALPAGTVIDASTTPVSKPSVES